MTTLPVRLELEYMLDQRRLMRELTFMTVASLHKRQDSDELLDFVRLTAPQVLDEKQLRRRLRQLANQLSNEQLGALSVLLGRPVPPPFPGTINAWIDEQVLAVKFTIEQWLLSATEEIRASRLKGISFADMTISLREAAKAATASAETRASSAILTLNAEMIQQAAQGAGSTAYRWMTEEDDRVRINHRPLHFTIQKWDDPPAGGGTKPEDEGHAGSGFGCRCTAIPLQGVPPM
jgi:SPP1 gp7 family putative phage head morphogenesis protein